MASISEAIIKKLQLSSKISSVDIEAPHSDIYAIIISLSSKGIVNFYAQETHTYALTDEGEKIAKNGSYEFKLYESVGEDGIPIASLANNVAKLNAFKYKLIRKDGDRVYKNIENATDITKELLLGLNSLSNADDISRLLKRKLIVKNKTISYEITRGPNFGMQAFETELTSRMIQDESYKKLKFKALNLSAVGNIPQCGSLHPLNKVKEEIKKIFIEMGFGEMNTSKYLESSFWNFDALYQPQHHPSRDSHDTFFIKAPASSDDFPTEYMERVSHVHSLGGFGSLGYRNEWDVNEARKNVMRTHTTSVTARYLYELAQKPYRPVKKFSIDKVYRNESVDATHLAEFHQVEGFILGKNLSLSDLMGIIKEFFAKMGISDIKFKPAYNPYTEPSMEVFGFHKGLTKWIEVGNSGMFRPELLRPMGFAEDIRVLGWGLSLERPAMIKYNSINIRELVGHKVNLEFSKDSEFVCF